MDQAKQAKQKPQDQLTASQAKSLSKETEDDVLRRMLHTPPKQHDEKKSATKVKTEKKS